MTYDSVVVDFDDRTLPHLQIVLVQRFTAGRPVLLSWLDAPSQGDGRSSMWLTPSSPLHFTFLGSRVPSIDRAWLDQLSQRADSGAGLVVCDEHGALLRAQDQRRVGPSQAVSSAAHQQAARSPSCQARERRCRASGSGTTWRSKGLEVDPPCTF